MKTCADKIRFARLVSAPLALKGAVGCQWFVKQLMRLKKKKKANNKLREEDFTERSVSACERGHISDAIKSELAPSCSAENNHAPIHESCLLAVYQSCEAAS